jgi:predicted phage terminase large subunit-like protein
MQTMSMLDEETLQQAIEKATPTEKLRLLAIVQELDQRRKKEKARISFMAFVEHMWPEFIHGSHHSRMANAFERVANGEIKRLAICMPPRHSKSEFASFLLPAWFLGLYPSKQIMQLSHTADLAEQFGRKVRNLVDSDVYHEVFPDTKLRKDSTAAARWNTDKNGIYQAMGVGAAVAGKGADLLIIDDPISEQEGKGLDPKPFDNVYDYYMTGPRQRLQPGGSIILVMCMTGDTPVLMADGKEKTLRSIRVGDDVATYDAGSVTTAKVVNWQSNGIDSVYKVQTQSGIIVRANKRHPFLVDNNGDLQWKKLQDLKQGDLLVSLKAVKDQANLLQSKESAAHVERETLIIKNTQMPHSTLLGIMANGKIKLVLKKGVKNLHIVKGYVLHTTTRLIGLLETIRGLQKKQGKPELSIGMGSLLRNTVRCMINNKGDVRSVERFLGVMLEHIGVENCVLTTATTQVKLEDYCAMTATLQLDTESPQKTLSAPLNTYVIAREAIESITYDGEEEVFDVQIDRTENFIANGIVSHNTRWNKRDLVGRLVDNAIKNPEGDQWELIEFPAILPSGKPLWPEFWALEDLLRTKTAIDNRFWQAQYQQNPTSEEGAIVKREWWQRWEHQNPPPFEYTIMAWDTAFEAHNRADYSAMTVWGVFYREDDQGVQRPNIIVLDAVKKRVEFPELKAWVLEAYEEWQPDSMIVEKRASGASLIQELRRMGVPVMETTPGKGNDKISRLNAVADIFASGFVWAPETRWADELIDDIASFPAGTHDDLVDSTVYAVTRLRQGGFIRTSLDEEDDETIYYRRKKAYY